MVNGVDVFEEKLTKDLPIVPFFIERWKVVNIDEPTYTNDYLHTKMYQDPNDENRLIQHSVGVRYENSRYENESEISLRYDVSETNYYLKKNKVSNIYFRKNGPAKVYVENRSKKDVYTIIWYQNQNDRPSRKNGPAVYDIEYLKQPLDNFDNLYGTEHTDFNITYFAYYDNKNRYTLHRIGGPAEKRQDTYKKQDQYYWYFNGRRLNAYQYWMIMVENFPKIYKVKQDENKIVFDPNNGVPQPHTIYKKKKSIIWKLNNKTASIKKYWVDQEIKDVLNDVYVLK